MRFLSYIILLFALIAGVIKAQSPHGDDLKLDCSLCHNSNNWRVDKDKITFEHNTTRFSLIGQHEIVDCKSCHTSLVFSKAESDCNSCHVDFHQESVGLDCSECHTPKSWMVEDINSLHQKSRFPLVGKHLIADCVSCHPRYVDLYFEVLDISCYSCHEADYNSTAVPNHIEAGFSTECEDCHAINADNWSANSIVHDFFPLVGGHAIQDCFSCHEQGGDFTGLSQECLSCHEQDYNNVQDPNHIQNNFPMDCTQCHSIFGWKPSTLDHNQTNFPLTGAHQAVECSSCHTSGYTGTPTECHSCHQQDYQSVVDPNHVTNGYPFDCTQCHTTNDWSATNFDHNLTAFELTGAHITVDCSGCHQAGYAGTSTDCFSCHNADYNNTVNPNHQAAGFPNSCVDCHSTSAWTPVSFDHDGQFFPIYSGKHSGKWNLCVDCHNVPSDYSVFSCITCHEHNQIDMDDKHSGIDGYTYESNACYSCHPTGEKEGSFNHALSNFPLTGSHTTVACIGCHENGYSNTPIDCVSCHQQDYNQSTNPNHQALVIPTDCNSCHTTDPNWQPASFTIHDQFYPLEGIHQQIAYDCNSCHNGDYNNTPNTCNGCHNDNYNNTVNPNHQAAGFPTSCEDCHSTSAWAPANFDHDGQFFPIYSGKHSGKWNLCVDCHNVPSDYSVFSCITCHEHNQIDMDGKHSGIDGYTYESNACYSCHPTGEKEGSFNHALSNFPLTGSHTTVACIGCHENGYSNTPIDCVSCHQQDYNQSTNPNHQALVLPTDCNSCHTTDPNWQPASFPIHDQIYQLLGAHSIISNNCTTCHQGDYNNTPNTCFGCHTNEYNGTNDPPHQILNISQECVECHNQSAWVPANFDHNFYPLSGNHRNRNCNECHSEPGYQPQCLDCHQNKFQDGHNPGDPTDCWNCHTTSNWDAGHGEFKLQRNY